MKEKIIIGQANLFSEIKAMDPPNEIGVVVVGLGIAGKVRVRDLKAKTGCLVLKGVVSRQVLIEEAMIFK